MLVARPETVNGIFELMTATSIRGDLLEFIHHKIGASAIQLTQNSPIEQTLGMAELDTIIFYNDFVKQFSIFVPADWDIRRHVSPVGFHNWQHYVRRLFSKTYRNQTDYRDLTVGELEQMIACGLWSIAE